MHAGHHSDDRGDGQWWGDDVILRSVGIDIGSATTHVIFSRLHLRRKGEQLSTAYAIVERRVLYESAIAFTPYRADGLIDADRLAEIVHAAYRAGDLTPESVDTGALLLTGEAVKRPNARAIGELLALESGRFVCASAGPVLEATLAAYGSGSVRLSASLGGDLLNIDIGGGSTKFALIRHGEIVQTAAMEIGGRLVVVDDGYVSRLESPVEPVAQLIGLGVGAGRPLARVDRWRLGRAMADLVVQAARGEALPSPVAGLWISEPLALSVPPAAITVSGGVGEYVINAGGMDLGDLGLPIAEGILAAIESNALPALLTPSETAIRATVIGASQFTVQVSGSTFFVSDRTILPLRNLPVVRPVVAVSAIADGHRQIQAALGRVEIQEGTRAAVFAFSWDVPPFHERLKAFCDWLSDGLANTRARAIPLVLVFDADIAYLVGRLLVEECGWGGPVVCLDSVDVREFDYLDIGQLVEPPGVVPVIVKSLVFASLSDAAEERGSNG